VTILNIFIYSFAYFYANNFFDIQKFRQTWIVFGIVIFSFLSFILANDVFKKDLKLSFEKMAYSIFSIIYIGLPSFFIPFLFNIDFNPANSVPIFFKIESHGTLTGSLLALFFIVITFSNDIFCYVFGITLGKNNRIGLEASPKKSWAGYLGGFFSTFVFSFVFYFLFDRYFNFIKLPVWFYLSIPLLSGFMVPLGDLVESVIKRSTSVKDSGSIVLGRGGVLDSVDSILYFIPVYFIFLQFYFSFL
jgi:CDP-diglyceride synthetase